MAPFEKPTYQRIYEECITLFKRIDETSKKRDLSLTDLNELLHLTEKVIALTERLMDASSIEDMFVEDAKRIRDSYLNDTLSRAYAQKAIQDLEKYLGELHGKTLELREQYQQALFMLDRLDKRFYEFRTLFKSVIHNLRKLYGLSRPPAYGISVTTLINRTKQKIRTIVGPRGKLPKKEFGVLQLSGNNVVEENIMEFLSEYSSGVIIAPNSLKEDVLEILEKYGEAQIEEKEIGNKILFMIQ